MAGRVTFDMEQRVEGLQTDLMLEEQKTDSRICNWRILLGEMKQKKKACDWIFSDFEGMMIYFQVNIECDLKGKLGVVVFPYAWCS